MELKVWLDGAVRVVSGLSPSTSCQDVVVALAQSIGQTGRYVLVLKLRGTERHLVAEDRPLQILAQLGNLAADVQLVLRRTGPSLSQGPDAARHNQTHLVPPRPAEPEPLRRNEPQKAFTFHLGPSTVPRRTKGNAGRSPSPRASPEPRPSPVGFLEAGGAPKEEAFRDLLQQQRRLQDLEEQLEALEQQTEFWEPRASSSGSPDLNRNRNENLNLSLAEELDQLERRFRGNEAELLSSNHWEQDLGEELEREQDMQRRLNQIQSSIQDHSHEIGVLQSRSARLEQEVEAGVQEQQADQDQDQDQDHQPLKQEVLRRLQLGEHLDSALWETQREIHTAEERVKDRSETMEELNKELRHCQLQDFIQQTGVPLNPDQTSPPAGDRLYLRNAGIME